MTRSDKRVVIRFGIPLKERDYPFRKANRP